MIDRLFSLVCMSVCLIATALYPYADYYCFLHQQFVQSFLNRIVSPETGVADLSKREMAGDMGATTPSDKTPLLQDRLMRSLSGVDQHEQYGKSRQRF